MNFEIINQAQFLEVREVAQGDFQFCMFTIKNPLKDTVNEDSMGYAITNNGSLVLLVADGAGGYPKGEEASLIVCESIVSFIKDLPAGHSEIDLRNGLLNGLEKANEKIVAIGAGSKTTLTACMISNRTARVIQVGDSGLLICGQKGKLKYKTVSHSPVGYGVESGYIEESEAIEHPDLHLVTNFVGGPDMKIDIGPPVELSDNDTLLIASDGILDNFTSEQLIEIVRKGQLGEVAELLNREAIKANPDNLNYKYDDFSYFILRLKSD